MSETGFCLTLCSSSITGIHVDFGWSIMPPAPSFWGRRCQQVRSCFVIHFAYSKTFAWCFLWCSHSEAREPHWWEQHTCSHITAAVPLCRSNPVHAFSLWGSAKSGHDFFLKSISPSHKTWNLDFGWLSRKKNLRKVIVLLAFAKAEILVFVSYFTYLY